MFNRRFLSGTRPICLCRIENSYRESVKREYEKDRQEKIGVQQLSPERRRSEMGHVKSNDRASIRRDYYVPTCRASKYDRLFLQGMRGTI